LFLTLFLFIIVGKGKYGVMLCFNLVAIGVILRVIVSTQQILEVGGDFPVGIIVPYIVLGALVALKNYEEIRIEDIGYK
jgi:hypothetical protein